jgi:fatty acid desaturase
MSDGSQRRTERGFLNPRPVRTVAFWTTTACLLVAVVAAILAIWQFTGTDALWRTVATCMVIGAATLAFSFVNGVFAPGESD